MQIKGTAVRTTTDFVKASFPAQYDEWFRALPPNIQLILSESVFANSWYKLEEAVLIPTEFVADMFYNKNREKAAFEIGIYSAKIALTGVYKIFVRIASPNFILSRAGKIFSSYYDDAIVTVIRSEANYVELKFEGFEFKEQLIIHRIAGWIEGALQVTNRFGNSVIVKPVFEDKIKKFVVTATWK